MCSKKCAKPDLPGSTSLRLPGAHHRVIGDQARRVVADDVDLQAVRQRLLVTGKGKARPLPDAGGGVPVGPGRRRTGAPGGAACAAGSGRRNRSGQHGQQRDGERDRDRNRHQKAHRTSVKTGWDRDRMRPGDENRISRRSQPLRRHRAPARATGELVPGALVVEGDRIVDVRTGATGTLPEAQIAADIVSPGLVDLQVNGGFGLEVGGDPAALRALAGAAPLHRRHHVPSHAGERARRRLSGGVGVLLGGAGRLGRAHARDAPRRAAAGSRAGGSPRSGAHRRGGRHPRRRARRAAGGGAGAAGDLGARAAGRSGAHSPTARCWRHRQPGAHRRQLRSDDRRPGRRRHAGHPSLQCHVPLSPPQSRRGRRGAHRFACHRGPHRRRRARPPGGLESRAPVPKVRTPSCWSRTRQRRRARLPEVTSWRESR